MASESGKRNIVIIGGGIIGSTTAYFLSHHPSFNRERDSITLLEATEIAGGASGKAGGLLALWAYPECIVPLSYRLHKELSDKHNGPERWDYRALHSGELNAAVSSNPASKPASTNPAISLQKRTPEALSHLQKANIPPDLDWITPSSILSYEEMGDPSNTAQVHPYKFTTSMAELAFGAGVKIVYGSATSIAQKDGAVESVMYTPRGTDGTETLRADTVILTAGPWTRSIWPSAPIEALRAHSVVIEPPRPVSAYALFTSISLPSSCSSTSKISRRAKEKKIVTPEIYARPDSTVYACGTGDTLIPLPTSTDLVQVDQARCDEIIEQVSAISPELANGIVKKRQACYLPNVEGGGGPLVGETNVKGLFIGAGHTCWGIQNAPGTACVLSEMIWEGVVRSAGCAELDPRGVGL
ncbi:FAD dependent oxidoreductase [Sporormia fimetaria CBS 119925]|uniref:FAD dependent oxidoreductase n=1 Tax=Sporormia fimetaria CBS 119925 TaxID=1340428 RepID=A0A6A6UYV9_9PLEO|nr:FAD dependent oxidoreductase [Sporormia fimetaria CBS 119925]